MKKKQGQISIQSSCNRSQSGQTLIEVLVALSVAVVIITAVTTAVLSSLSNAQFTKNQTIGTEYAQQAMEIIRTMRSSNITTFKSLSGAYCLAKTCTVLTASAPECWQKQSSCGQNADIFMREVDITPNAASCNSSSAQATQVNALVSWSDGKCKDMSNPFCHTVTLSSCLSDYTIIPSP